MEPVLPHLNTITCKMHSQILVSKMTEITHRRNKQHSRFHILQVKSFCTLLTLKYSGVLEKLHVYDWGRGKHSLTLSPIRLSEEFFQQIGQHVVLLHTQISIHTQRCDHDLQVFQRRPDLPLSPPFCLNPLTCL